MWFHKKSQCYDRLDRYIAKQFKNLEDSHLTKWNFFKNQVIEDEYPGGNPIKIGGVGLIFEGSPCQIFWDAHYIPGYIEKIFDECLEICAESGKQFNIHPNKRLQELEELFLPKIPEVFGKMAEIDSRLRGDGINIPLPQNTEGYSENLQEKIKKRLDFYKLGLFKSLLWWLQPPIDVILKLIKIF
ncbi:MAG: hypothetical protein ACOH2E_06860 [Candidatus Paracaedibacter sp.]